jgi:tRNA G46 methylase TrmB
MAGYTADMRCSPTSPELMDWSGLFPAFVQPKASGQDSGSGLEAPVPTVVPRRLVKDVEVADIGCGFGGLLMALSPIMPETLILGIVTPTLQSHTATKEDCQA